LARELVALKRLIAEQGRCASVLADARLLLQSAQPRVIRVLQVRPNGGSPFQMERLSGLCQEIPGLRIEVSGVTAADFSKGWPFVNTAYSLKKFNVVFVGGSDASKEGFKDLTPELIDRSLVDYHRDGGKVVILHDTAWEFDSQPRKWTYFLKQMGKHSVFNEFPKGVWREVKRRDFSGACPAILTSPFKLPEPFPVAPTHGNQLFAAEKAVLVGTTQDSTYYAESEGIAFCEAGHTPQLTEWEWKFLVNVICHLSEARPT
jgi:hypothetical protein